MEKKFIKYKEGQVNLARLYNVSSGKQFNAADVLNGVLVVGYTGNGQFLQMGYLRGISSNRNGEVLYEIDNATEGGLDIIFIKSPVIADSSLLPYMAAAIDSDRPIVGKVISCNGKLAVIDNGTVEIIFDVNCIHELVPYFKETK